MNTDIIPPIARGVMEETGMNPYAVLADHAEQPDYLAIQQMDFQRATDRILASAPVESLDHIVLLSNEGTKELMPGPTPMSNEEAGELMKDLHPEEIEEAAELYADEIRESVDLIELGTRALAAAERPSKALKQPGPAPDTPNAPNGRRRPATAARKTTRRQRKT